MEWKTRLDLSWGVFWRHTPSPAYAPDIWRKINLVTHDSLIAIGILLAYLHVVLQCASFGESLHDAGKASVLQNDWK